MHSTLDTHALAPSAAASSCPVDVRGASVGPAPRPRRSFLEKLSRLSRGEYSWKEISYFLRRKVHLHPDRPRWSRLVMEEQCRQWVRELNPSRLDCLEISGSDWKDFGFKSYRHADFPEYDVCQGPLEHEAFDLIIAEQVWEHLLWPYRAARHVHEMLRPGGWFLITTPFLIRIHDFPVDCSRWTELGMRHFLAECGFPLDSVRTGSWGNKQVIMRNLRPTDSVRYIPWMHSLKNNPILPYSVWALARKSTRT